MRHSWGPAALIVAAALALAPSISLAQSNIGSAASVRNQVEGVIGGQTHTLSTGSAVHANELIRSGEGAVANLVFIDETQLSVGPRSEVRLDKFVYDPSKKTGTVVVRATRGAYRFVTGVQDPRNYEIKTPYATLGVRGTILEVDLDGVEAQAHAQAGVRDDRGARADRGCENYVKIKLVEGAFVARTISGRTVMITEPDTVLTVCSSGSFQTTQVAESILNFSPDTAFAVVDPGPGPMPFAVAAGLLGGGLAVIIASEQDEEPASADGSPRRPRTIPSPPPNSQPNAESIGQALR
jgi:hypothetical protein